MKRWMSAFVAVATILTTTAAMAAAPTDQQQKADDATGVLRQFVDIPENAIPSALLRQAYGIAVIPSVLKVGFIGGVRRGKGLLSVRTADGQWSNPVFITLTGGSFGFQAGVSSTDIILVFKTQRSIDKIANGQFSLGGDAAVAAGPVGRAAGAATNLDFNAEVYSYSRSRGLFAGVSVEGARLGIDKDADWLFYNQAGITARSILLDSNDSNIPQSGQRFVYTLERYMPASNNQFNYSSTVNGRQSSVDGSSNDSTPPAAGNGASNGSYGGGYYGPQGQENSGQTQGQGGSQTNGQIGGQTTPYSSNSGVSVQQNATQPSGSDYSSSNPGNYQGSSQGAAQNGGGYGNQSYGASSGGTTGNGQATGNVYGSQSSGQYGTQSSSQNNGGYGGQNTGPQYGNPSAGTSSGATYGAPAGTGQPAGNATSSGGYGSTSYGTSTGNGN